VSVANERSCIGCKNWAFNPGRGPWSDVTPGEDWSAQCLKFYTDPKGDVRVHWYMDGDDDASTWFKTMQAAKDCPDYDPRPGAPK
jgi:hypothetical protein